MKNPPEPFERSAHRLESLDSIRGLAALAVLFSHVFDAVFIWPENWIKWSKYPLINMAFDGTAAVAMFFVLSGFVLARPYVSAKSAPLNIPVFYIRRVIRIWFPWFCAFAVSLVCRCLLFRDYATQPPQDPRLWHVPVLLKDILLQCIFFVHGRAELLPQDWSLGVELIGSALIPLFVVIARRPLNVVWLAALGIVSVAVVPHGENFPGGGAFYVSFIIGVLIARHQETLVACLKGLTLSRRVLILAAGLALYQARRPLDHLGYNGSHLARTVWLIMTAGAGLIILTTLSSRRLAALLTTKPVLWIGRISYSVYLLQIVILLCLLPPAIAVLNKLGFGSSPWMFLFCLVISFAATVGIATPFYKFVELPSIAFGHYVSAKLKKKAGVAAAPASARPLASGDSGSQ
ncbi:MAG TPA: acyltransferase [Candidatus Acidoferrales bacterium]|jgi:peptidoglycan/LPS O-acetylase OafA/YrhL|nr:acyltransferase [Candidatus Acidoferrales bacterium]